MAEEREPEGDLHGFIHRQFADSAEQRSEILPVHILHGQVRLALRLADVIDATDIGMRHLACEADFATQAAAVATKKVATCALKDGGTKEQTIEPP